MPNNPFSKEARKAISLPTRTAQDLPADTDLPEESGDGSPAAVSVSEYLQTIKPDGLTPDQWQTTVQEVAAFERKRDADQKREDAQNELYRLFERTGLTIEAFVEKMLDAYQAGLITQRQYHQALDALIDTLNSLRLSQQTPNTVSE